jgi:hypothetical protein
VNTGRPDAPATEYDGTIAFDAVSPAAALAVDLMAH